MDAQRFRRVALLNTPPPGASARMPKFAAVAPPAIARTAMFCAAPGFSAKRAASAFRRYERIARASGMCRVLVNRDATDIRIRRQPQQPGALAIVREETQRIGGRRPEDVIGAAGVSFDTPLRVGVAARRQRLDQACPAEDRERPLRLGFVRGRRGRDSEHHQQ
ncbi:MAG: hypothetical protein ACXW5U_07525 [Thermoanaerobaculia bacterium]